MLRLDILVVASHPDDAELGCAGTILKEVKKGRKVGIVDLTRGELGTRGTAETREIEANQASKILQLSARENLQLEDGFFEADKASCLALISKIRKYRPDVVIANAPSDRHPDHGMGNRLTSRAAFLSGLQKIKTSEDGTLQEAWRPRGIFYYIQDRYLTPDFVIDISSEWEEKLKAIFAYETQFYKPGASGPVTHISTPEFKQFLEGRAREMGHSIGVQFGEGFIKEQQLAVKDFFDIL